MAKKLIAIDVDDVLAAAAPAFVAFSNERWDTHLTPEDFSEHWAEMWQVDLEETARRFDIYATSGLISTYKSMDAAKETLQELKKHYRLAVVTSRSLSLEAETVAWLKQEFGSLLDEVHFSGIYEAGLSNETAIQTKAAVFQRIGASYVVDDQLKHCLAAAEVGIPAVLFGDYKWNWQKTLPKLVRRCKDWAAVREYFDGRKD